MTTTKTEGTKRKPSKSAKKSKDKADGKPKSKKERKGSDKKKRKPKPAPLTAKTADKHVLYQYAVQSPEEDVRFLTRVYKKKRGRLPQHFREDFCGTGLLSGHWAKRGAQYSAEGFDICPDTVGWGIDNVFAPLGDTAERVTLHIKDVREPSQRKPDVRAAQNFSYFVFKQRAELLEYARAAYADLAEDGVFVMDIYGGPDSMMEVREEREIEEGFTYVWDQAEYWPATGDYRAHIHFEFKDGTKLKRAFSYDWRLWGITEVQDLLREAGFPEVETFWEGTAKDGESGNGVYRRSRKGENCEAWVTYVVAYK